MTDPSELSVEDSLGDVPSEPPLLASTVQLQRLLLATPLTDEWVTGHPHILARCGWRKHGEQTPIPRGPGRNLQGPPKLPDSGPWPFYNYESRDTGTSPKTLGLGFHICKLGMKTVPRSQAC